jgi:hypothetical protein
MQGVLQKRNGNAVDFSDVLFNTRTETETRNVLRKYVPGVLIASRSNSAHDLFPQPSLYCSLWWS